MVLADIRRLDSFAYEELIVNAPVATVLGTGIGYGGDTINTVIYGELDDSSTWTVNIGTNEHKRIVEWLDGDGVYRQESASIKVTVETNWGNFVEDVVAPRTSSANIDVVYPQLSIDKVEPEAVTADTGRSHGVMVTISNTGTVAADPNVRCYVDDVEAQTTVPQPIGLLNLDKRRMSNNVVSQLRWSSPIDVQFFIQISSNQLVI